MKYIGYALAFPFVLLKEKPQKKENKKIDVKKNEKVSTINGDKVDAKKNEKVLTVKDKKHLSKEEKAKLKAEGIAVADDIEVGIMIEIPAAAMLADQFAKEVDFFSIGTNDLIQYTMAADRMNEQVSYLYQPYNPSILRLINNVIKAAHAEGKWAGMCGEMAGDQQAVPLLVGMGLDEFSMSATSVLRTRSLMKTLDTAKMQEYANRALTECSTMEEVLELSKEYVD